LEVATVVCKQSGPDDIVREYVGILGWGFELVKMIKYVNFGKNSFPFEIMLNKEGFSYTKHISNVGRGFELVI